MSEMDELHAQAAKAEAATARNNIVAIAILGVFVAVIGSAIAVAERPRTTVYGAGTFGASVVTTGNDTVYSVGLILAGVGYLMLMVCVIAWGVRLGVKSAKS